MAKGKIMLT